MSKEEKRRFSISNWLVIDHVLCYYLKPIHLQVWSS